MPTTSIDFQILGVGAWGPTFHNWSDLQALLKGEILEVEASKGPKPEVIPANERRRAPLPVRLSVESSWQACQAANLEPADLVSVFVSGLGDTQLTDYMCRTLASDNKALSPTKFHNSVHNAAAGYWTISTGCMQAANSVAGFQQSVSLTLLEALIQCQAEQRPILLTFYDAPCSEVLRDLMKNEIAFAASVIVAPAEFVAPEGNAQSSSLVYQMQLQQQSADWPQFDADDFLQQCYTTNPVGRILPLLKTIAQAGSEPISLPVSAETSIHIIQSEAVRL
ncbi:MAG: beta-ketoacyl synthase chain length factor [Acidiferrobacterales bacterium]|nr:beta-ketoacyl synthase chain length factor [Acidiferrobacterales bacterium]